MSDENKEKKLAPVVDFETIDNDRGDGNFTRIDIRADGTRTTPDGKIYQAPQPK